MKVRKFILSVVILFLLYISTFFTIQSLSLADDVKTDSSKAGEKKIASIPVTQEYSVDGITNYTKVSGLSGVLYCEGGANSFEKVFPYWIEAFHRLYPDVEVKFTPNLSQDAIPALLKSQTQIGLLSRPIKASEVEEFSNKFGYKPSWVSVFLEAITIIVNMKNPLHGLTLEQLDSIYSRTLKQGSRNSIERWEDLGIEGELGKQKIAIYSRPLKTAIGSFFVENVLLNGDMRPEAQEIEKPLDLIKQVSENRTAIGFCGYVGDNDYVKVVPVGKKTGQFFSPREININSGNYPISRSFIMAFNRKPGQNTDKLTYEFLRFVLCLEAQMIVFQKGFCLLPPDEIQRAFRIIN